MASGKSTAAAKIAADSGWRLICLDRQIEESCGLSIAQIFAEKGEAEFRQIESRLLQDALAVNSPPKVIDAGGGIVLLEQNRRLLEQACVIFLDTGISDILHRLKNGAQIRPLLAGLDGEEVRQLWQARRQVYVKTADFVVKDMAELNELFDRIIQRG